MARFGLAAALVLIATPALASNQDEPVAGRTPDAEDVAMTPITDLNLKKDAIPPVLLAAVDAPYSAGGLLTCDAIADGIASLDAALGPDMDVAKSEGERISAGVVAKSVVASFIPFRGIIRELTGAADHQRDFQAAIYAGAVRRGFLKGLGQQKGCAYPARPAFARVEIAQVKPKSRGKSKGTVSSTLPTNRQTTFVSQPVVQPLPPVSATTRRK